jgi:hypothetical protein
MQAQERDTFSGEPEHFRRLGGDRDELADAANENEPGS